MNKINGWDKDGDMCHICGKKEDLTCCEGCNNLSCEEHFTEALCNTCMDKVKAMSKIGTPISKIPSWIKKEWNKNRLDEDAIKGIILIAQTMVTYNNALIEEGMSKEDALKMTIAYQGQQIEAATKAGIEEKKNLMLFTKMTVNN